ncbi:MAG: AraC family transcriptional regulator [Rhodoferax sp.]
MHTLEIRKKLVSLHMTTYATTMPVTFVKTFLEGARVDQLELGRILQLAGITEKLLSLPDARITQEQFSALFQLLVAHLDDEMPGLYGRPLRRGTLKVLAILLLDAPTLHAALRRWQQFDHILSDDFSFSIDRGEATTGITINRYPREAASARLVQEFHMKLVHGIASWVIDRKIALERVDFAFPRPDDASEYVFIFPGPVYFNQPVTAMHLDSSYLDEPIRYRSQLDLRNFLFSAPRNWFFVPLNQTMLSHRLRKHLESRLSQPTSIQTTAEALNYSTRTLSRRLADEGTSFHQIKDALQRDAAIQRLVKTKDPVEDIAAGLGFGSTSAFYRAFHVWTGGTPRSYRRRKTHVRG